MARPHSQKFRLSLSGWIPGRWNYKSVPVNSDVTRAENNCLEDEDILTRCRKEQQIMQDIKERAIHVNPGHIQP